MRVGTRLYVLLVALVAASRLVELRVSRRHSRLLLHEGAEPAPDPLFRPIVALHIAVLLGSLTEICLLHRPVKRRLAMPMFIPFAAATVLRLWVIRTLGAHWNVRILNSLDRGVITTGPYRWIRHPNYVAVFTELVFLPLLHSAWITATLGALAHLVILFGRIRSEEALLMARPHYVALMRSKPRFLPRFGRR